MTRAKFGGEGTARAMATAELARIYTQPHKYAAAKSLFLQSIELLQSPVDSVASAHFVIPTYFGDYYMTRLQWTNAEAEYRTALAVAVKLLGEQAPTVGRIMGSLAQALRKQHRKKESGEYERRGSAIPGVADRTISIQSLSRK